MDNKDIWWFLNLAKKGFIMPIEEFRATTAINIKFESDNEFTMFYRGEGLKLTDKTNVENIELRVSKEELHFPSLLSFTISGRCITFKDIKGKFSFLEIVDYPRGHSLNDVTTYATKSDDHGVRLGFSFAETDPGCLARVVIRR